MLLHEESEAYNDPYADPYEDSPDSSHGRCPAEEAEISQQAAGLPSDSTSSGDKSKPTDDDQAKEGEEGPGDGLPEQNVGTDVKR